MQNDAGQLDLFELTSMARLREMRLSSVIRVARFSRDGKRRPLLTADQRLLILDTEALSRRRRPTLRRPDADPTARAVY